MADHKPSPWAGPKQQKLTDLMAIPKITEFVNKLREVQLDESKATTDYIGLSNDAHDLGLTNIANILQKLSQDEHNHFVALTTILRNLEA